MGFATAHGLRQHEHGRTRCLACEMSKGAIHKGEHSRREVVLFKKLAALDLTLQERVEAQDGGPSIRDIDGRTRSALGF